jgi:transposase
MSSNRTPPSVPIIGETTASSDITVEGEEVEAWKRHGSLEENQRWWAERKEGGARLELRPPPQAPPPPRDPPPPTSAAAVPGRSTPEPRVSSNGEPIPDPSVPERPVRRRFTADDKLRILREADGCTQLGQLGALLRREGLYSSHLSTWRRQRDAGTLAGLTPQRRGRKPTANDPVVAENERLQRENQRLAAKLRQAETIIEVQKKLSEVLGIPLPPSGNSEKMP